MIAKLDGNALCVTTDRFVDLQESGEEVIFFDLNKEQLRQIQVFEDIDEFGHSMFPGDER